MAEKKEGVDEELQPYSDEAVSEFLRERQERIAVRRARIGTKIASKSEGNVEAGAAVSLDLMSNGGISIDESRSMAVTSDEGGTAGSTTGDKKKARGKAAMDPLDLQIEESRKLLEQIILDGENLITNVRIAAECREKVRLVKQSESRKDRLERLHAEAEECQGIYNELKPNFNISAEKKLPMDLFDAVKTQMQACEELLMRKQDLIQELQQELEENDFQYEQSLEMYQKDVSLMGDRIDDCVDELQGAFLNELGLVEDYTTRNREVQLEENHKEWMELLTEFQSMEEKNLERRKGDALNKFQMLNDLYINVKQECRAHRHKFEDDLRILIQELEQIKYATQLNMEKLQYNLAIVKKRHKENVEMKNMMKRLLLKFSDRFTTKSRALKQKMEAGRKEAKRILLEISRLETSLDQFGAKTLHLATSDWNKYMDLWHVNEDLVRDKVQRLLDSEKFIFETQLGLRPKMPDLSFMDKRPELVTKHITRKNTIYAALVGIGPPPTKAKNMSMSSDPSSRSRRSKYSPVPGRLDRSAPSAIDDTEADAEGEEEMTMEENDEDENEENEEEEEEEEVEDEEEDEENEVNPAESTKEIQELHELPTMDELIDKKLTMFKYPFRNQVTDYWERSLKMLSMKSDELWDGMQYSFEEFNASLKKRNAMVDEVVGLYRKNYELSYLMKNQVEAAGKRFLTTKGSKQLKMTGGYC